MGQQPTTPPKRRDRTEVGPGGSRRVGASWPAARGKVLRLPIDRSGSDSIYWDPTRGRTSAPTGRTPGAIRDRKPGTAVLLTDCSNGSNGADRTGVGAAPRRPESVARAKVVWGFVRSICANPTLSGRSRRTRNRDNSSIVGGPGLGATLWPPPRMFRNPQ